MQQTLSFRLRNRYKLKQEKWPVTLRHIITCIVQNILFPISNCLKRTEVCWFVKRTFYITITPCLRCITQFYFITIDFHSIKHKDKIQQGSIQAILMSGRQYKKSSFQTQSSSIFSLKHVGVELAFQASSVASYLFVLQI